MTADLAAPYVPVMIYNAEARMLEFVLRDVAVVTQTGNHAAEVLLDMHTLDVVGFRLYGKDFAALDAATTTREDAPDAGGGALRERFEEWYCAHAQANGRRIEKGIAALRDGDGYGADRHYLNGSWDGFQGGALAATARPAAAEGSAEVVELDEGAYRKAREVFVASYDQLTDDGRLEEAIKTYLAATPAPVGSPEGESAGLRWIPDPDLLTEIVTAAAGVVDYTVQDGIKWVIIGDAEGRICRLADATRALADTAPTLVPSTTSAASDGEGE